MAIGRAHLQKWNLLIKPLRKSTRQSFGMYVSYARSSKLGGSPFEPTTTSFDKVLL